MNKLLSWFVLCYFLGSPFNMQAQGIHFNLLAFHPYINKAEGVGLYWGFGYQRNLGTKVSLSFEINKNYNTSEHDNYRGSYSSSGDWGTGYGFDYYREFSWYEFSYQSKYFFKSNSEFSEFVSTGISLRHLNQDMTILSSYADPPYASVADEIKPGNYDEEILLFPLTFRIGQRGDLDGAFGEWFVGVSYIPGANSKMPSKDSFFYDRLDEHSLQPWSFSFGVLIGVGWAR